MKSTPRETTQQTISRIIARDAADRDGQPARQLSFSTVEKRAEGRQHAHYEAVFAYSDGGVEVFGGHGWTTLLPASDAGALG
jgi:hypothetical protein